MSVFYFMFYITLQVVVSVPLLHLLREDTALLFKRKEQGIGGVQGVKSLGLLGVRSIPRLHVCQLLCNLGVSFLRNFQHFHFKSQVYLAF